MAQPARPLILGTNVHVRIGSWPCNNARGWLGGPEGQITLPQAASAAISGVVPTMFMTRVRL